MGYQALLFCPEEKTARTVTQVLNELEFSVESCTEPFAAVKKLMAEHFDAVVVDCDNEQNATLLFKSARNSTSNQTSLAVAVVEGQAGVAKAFRIGANLVLTKPINVEQAKGTLRVARGLLRKGDPTKPAAPGASASAPKTSSGPDAPSKPTAPFAPSAVQRLPGSAPVPKPPVSRPVQGASAKAASPTPFAKTPAPIEPDVLDVDTEAPIVPPAPKSASLRPVSKVSAPAGGTGAASAPAPARAANEILFEEPAGASTVAATSLAVDNAGSPVPAPSFTFGGANAPESTGGSKKAIIGVAAVLLIAAGLYFGWTLFHGKSTAPSSAAQQPPSTSSLPPQATQPSQPQPRASSPQAASATSVPSTANSLPSSTSNSPVEKPDMSGTDDSGEEAPENSAPAPRNSAKRTNAESPASAKPARDTKPAPQPIMVKNRTAAAPAKSAPAVDAPAPSVLDMAPTTSGGELPNLIPDANAPQPVLQTLNVSQGVSQGLLIKKVQPTYPPTALRMHVEGSVQLAATIGKSGSITSVKILNGEPLLAQAALDAVKQWKYKPYFLNGEPVEIQTQITVNFRLPR